MIGHTKSFKKLKTEQQKILDFSILVCYAVPNLKKSIKGYKEQVKNYETFVKPDYFVSELNVLQLEGFTHEYKNSLGKYTLLSIFSFFENFIKDVVIELIEFHGGTEKFVSTVHSRHKGFINNQTDELIEIKKKLQEPIKKKINNVIENILTKLKDIHIIGIQVNY